MRSKIRLAYWRTWPIYCVLFYF